VDDTLDHVLCASTLNSYDPLPTKLSNPDPRPPYFKPD